MELEISEGGGHPRATGGEGVLLELPPGASRQKSRNRLSVHWRAVRFLWFFLCRADKERTLTTTCVLPTPLLVSLDPQTLPRYVRGSAANYSG